MKFKQYQVIILLAAMFIGFSPSAVLAIGMVSSPFVIEEAVRGSEYEAILNIVNNDESAATLDFVAEGDIQQWVTFYYPSDATESTDSMAMQAGENSRALAVITVPDDTANGIYSGLIGVKTRPVESDDSEGSSAAVIQRVNRLVTINVSDQESIDLAVSVIPHSYDLEVGDALNIRFIYDNQSNVSLKPQIQVRLLYNGEAIHNAIYPFPDDTRAVRPQAQFEIPSLDIPTLGFPEGRYLAKIDFLNNDEIIDREEFIFRIGEEQPVANVVDVKSNLNSYAIYGILILIIVILIFIVGVQKGKTTATEKNSKKELAKRRKLQRNWTINNK